MSPLFVFMITKDKIRGMFLGVFLGDAIGCPVESWPADKIRNTYGCLDICVPPTLHKYFFADNQGTYTDDTQLTLVVAKSIIESDLDVQKLAENHVLALKQSIRGWGTSTRESIRRIANGCSFLESGNSSGVGNGIAMKIAPVGAYQACQTELEALAKVDAYILQLTEMTHKTSVALASAFVMVEAVKYCFVNEFKADEFIFRIQNTALQVENSYLKPLWKDNLSDPLKKLENYKKMSYEDIISIFGQGTCYCYNSIPFSLAFFLKNPFSSDAMIAAINSGGDTDSNGSIVGGLVMLS